ncbi:AraC family transcriptional regulator [Colwelliaceae bacterium 6471]
MKLGDIAVSYIDIVINAMSALGCESDAVLAQYGLNSKIIASPDARISIPKFMRFGHSCIHSAQAPWLGLEMGKVTSPAHLGLAGFIALSSDTIADAFANLTLYELLNSYNVRGQSSFYLEQGCAVLQFYSISPYNAYNYFVVDSVLSAWYHAMSWLGGNANDIEKICFEFPAPQYADKYRDYFACEVLFEQDKNCMVISAEAVKFKCLHHCQSTNAALIRQADNELNKVRLGLSFHEKVSRVIGPLLNDSTPTLEQVAEQLNMTPWTLRRRLVAEGGSFQQSLNRTRLELAISYVCDTTLSLGEISYLLGFSSSSAFQRAFKRWTGAAPGQYREAASAKKI